MSRMTDAMSADLQAMHDDAAETYTWSGGSFAAIPSETTATELAEVGSVGEIPAYRLGAIKASAFAGTRPTMGTIITHPASGIRYQVALTPPARAGSPVLSLFVTELNPAT